MMLVQGVRARGSLRGRTQGATLSSRRASRCVRRSRKDNQVNSTKVAAISRIGTVCGWVTNPTTAPHPSRDSIDRGLFFTRRIASTPRHAGPRVAVGLLLTTLLLIGCASANGTRDSVPREEDARRHAWVSVDGDDEADGSPATPLATIRRALDTRVDVIHLMAGRHDVPEVVLTRTLRLEGPEEGRALVAGHVFISADSVHVDRVDFGEGLAAHGVRDLRVSQGRVAAGSRDEALLFTRSEAILEDVEISPGSEVGLEAVDSRLRLSRVKIRARAETKRGLRVDASQVRASTLAIRAGKTVHLQVTDRSNVAVSDLVVGGGEGTGLMVLSSSTVAVERGQLARSPRFGLLTQQSRVRLTSTNLTGGHLATIGVQGGRLHAVTSTIGPSPGGGIVLSAFRGSPARAELQSCTILHGPFDGARVADGHFVARTTRFAGTQPENSAGGSAAIAHGVGAHIELLGARIVSPAGHGLVATEDATARISGRIERPGQGGVHIEGVRVTAARVNELYISDCRKGSGVTAIDSDVNVDDLVIHDCPQAGILAGARSTVQSRRVRIITRGRYGFAAFGGATLTIEDGRADGASWAAFASCADGAQLIDEGDNQLNGPVTTCP